MSEVEGKIRFYLWVDSVRIEWNSQIPHWHQELLGVKKPPHTVIGIGSRNSSQYDTIM